MFNVLTPVRQSLELKTQTRIWTKRWKHIWTNHKLRQTFIAFFQIHGHVFVPSSSVIPKKGDGTYFTNAGMNQFKPLFLDTVQHGSSMAEYKRVVNSQKCIRVGGQHNDLDDVGHDLSHHTFFEMLGNWSFGDFFKIEACSMAYTLLIDVFHLPKDRLYFTYFGGDKTLGLLPDEEVKTIWHELGVPDNHILPFGMKDNFWDMGTTGPCGPCTEIHYDHIGNEGGASLVNIGSPDVVEIWNLVFMQFNRLTETRLDELSSKHVDTGMGLERMYAVLQGSKSNYSTDLFSPLFHTIHQMSKAPVYGDRVGVEDITGLDTAYRILADHTRMFTAAIADGLLPDRFGLGHKLRCIMHRSIQQAIDVFHCDESLLLNLVDQVSISLGETYPEMTNNKQKVKDVVLLTFKNYRKTKENGKKAFDKMMRKHGGVTALTGNMVYELSEGFYGYHVPVDMIIDLARERKLIVHMIEFGAILEKSQVDKGMSPVVVQDNHLPTSHLLEMLRADKIITDDSYKYSYTSIDGQYVFEELLDCKISKIVTNNNFIERLDKGVTAYIILDKTLFYSEAGGQSSDGGQIVTKNGVGVVMDVQVYDQFILHKVQVTEGCIRTGEESQLQLNKLDRMNNMRNHTATHLLNSALRKLLVDSQQRGSHIQPHKFTFDFSSVGSLNKDDIISIEMAVKQWIEKSQLVDRKSMTVNDALAIPGIVSLPNEVYPDTVCVIKIGDDISTELCGGTHVHSTADIYNFYIIKMSGVSQGTKRVTCVTGDQATQTLANRNKLIEFYKDAENNVKYLQGPDTWNLQLKNLYKMLKLELLPKVTRDEYQIKVEQLQTVIRTELNKIIIQHIKQLIDKQMTTICRDPVRIIRKIPSCDPKIVNKSIKGCVVPVLLVSDEKQESSLFTVSLPHKSDCFLSRLNKCGFKAKITEKLHADNHHVYCVLFKTILSSEDHEQTENALLQLIKNTN